MSSSHRLRPHERAAVLTAYLRGEVETPHRGTARAAGRGLLRQVEPRISPWGAYRVYVLTLKGARVAAQLLYNGRGQAAISARHELLGPQALGRLDRSGGRRREERVQVAVYGPIRIDPARAAARVQRYLAEHPETRVIGFQSTSNATPCSETGRPLPPGRYTVVATAQDPEPPAAPADGTPRAKE